METNRSIKGQETKLIGSEQVPSGQHNLNPSMEKKMEDPQQIKSHGKRKKTSRHVNIIETPTEMPKQQLIWKMVEES